MDHDELSPVDTESGFARAIREHLELKSRNSELDTEMPIDRYLDGDPLDNHPLFKSEEQARIEETMDGEPAAELSSERLPVARRGHGRERRGRRARRSALDGRPAGLRLGRLRPGLTARVFHALQASISTIPRADCAAMSPLTLDRLHL